MKKLLIAAAIASLAGCATGPELPKVRGNVTPLANNAYQVTSTAANAQDAQKKALESAQAVCNERAMRHIVSSQKTEYKGQYGTEAARDIIDQKNQTIAALKRQTYIVPLYERRNDYVATVDFTCER